MIVVCDWDGRGFLLGFMCLDWIYFGVDGFVVELVVKPFWGEGFVTLTSPAMASQGLGGLRECCDQELEN